MHIKPYIIRNTLFPGKPCELDVSFAQKTCFEVSYFSVSAGGRHPVLGFLRGQWHETSEFLLVHPGIYWFPATSESVGAWQYAQGTAPSTSAGAASSANVQLDFNRQGKTGGGTKHGLLNAAGDAISGEGGLEGWAKRTGLCRATMHPSLASGVRSIPGTDSAVLRVNTPQC